MTVRKHNHLLLITTACNHEWCANSSIHPQNQNLNDRLPPASSHVTTPDTSRRHSSKDMSRVSFSILHVFVSHMSLCKGESAPEFPRQDSPRMSSFPSCRILSSNSLILARRHRRDRPMFQAGREARIIRHCITARQDIRSLVRHILRIIIQQQMIKPRRDIIRKTRRPLSRTLRSHIGRNPVPRPKQAPRGRFLVDLVHGLVLQETCKVACGA